MQLKTLHIKDLSYGQIIRHTSFTWRQGETLALMGANGSGKSTLAKILAGVLDPGSGTVELRGSDDAVSADNGTRWREIGFVGQHPRRQAIGASVGEELAFGLLNKGYKVNEVKDKVKELSAALDLAGKENQHISTLSGGERQRLVTAAVLAMEPSFLILDEALTMLDRIAEQRVLDLLDGVRGKTGQLWITHDPDLASRADRLLLLKDGLLCEVGSPTLALENLDLRREYSIRPKVEASLGEEIRTGIMPNDGRRSNSVEHIQDKPIFGWRLAAYGERLRLDRTVREKEFIGILGVSGAGKSTLVESAIYWQRPDKGAFLVDTIPLAQRDVGNWRKRARLLLQEAGDYLIGHNVYEEVFFNQEKKEKIAKKAANLTYLAEFGLPAEYAERAPERLSGGERQKVALAAALESGPAVLLLDEPLLGLDGQARAAILNLLAPLRHSKTILYVTHDLSEIISLADKLWLVENGEIVLECSMADWEQHIDRLTAAGVKVPTA